MARQMSNGQRAYEAKRAAKAGMSLDKWLTTKQRERAEAEREREVALRPAEPKKPGFLGRLLERAHKPL